MNFRDAVAIKSNNIHIENFLPKLGIDQAREEIFEGLQCRNKYISSKFFYDETGSDLFEQITHLPEYYPTRTEKHILKNLQLNFLTSFKNLNIIELGSGDPSKVSLLLDKIPEKNLSGLNYVPIDISASAIEYSGKKLLDLFPQINIKGIVADFMKQLDYIPIKSNRIFCFFGSTIGNFTAEQADKFMQNMSEIVKQDEFFWVGFDNIKDIKTLEKAYNDEQGITAKFNLNILNVVNSIAETNFKTSDFEHIAFYNTQEKRIEMHLEAAREVEIKSKFLEKSFLLKKGERIHTENSHKFDKQMISKIANHANFNVETIFTDEKSWFSVALLKKI
jgi:L-histidine N-alpha-methyltransferase